jgi:hypothetical protein
MIKYMLAEPIADARKPVNTPEKPDFLEEMIAESEWRSPGFADKVEAAYKRRVSGRVK